MLMLWPPGPAMASPSERLTGAVVGTPSTWQAQALEAFRCRGLDIVVGTGPAMTKATSGPAASQDSDDGLPPHRATQQPQIAVDFAGSSLSSAPGLRPSGEAAAYASVGVAVIRWSVQPHDTGHKDVRIEVFWQAKLWTLARGVCPVPRHSPAQGVELLLATAVGLVGPAWQALKRLLAQEALSPDAGRNAVEHASRGDAHGQARKGETEVSESGATRRLHERGRLTGPGSGASDSVLATAREKGRRWVFGALGERSWRVGLLDTDVDPEADTVIATAEVSEVAAAPGIRYISDPLAQGSTLWVEAYSRRSGLGEIHQSTAGEWSRLVFPQSGHYSYPLTVRLDDGWWLLPEMANVGSQRLFRLPVTAAAASGASAEMTSAGAAQEGTSGGRGHDSAPLDSVPLAGLASVPLAGLASVPLAPLDSVPLAGLEHLRLADATLFPRGDYWYLFAGARDPQQHLRLADMSLRLFVAPAAAGPFVEHPDSPVLIDPHGARMAGQIFEHEGQLYRPGQDNRTRYGDGVVFHRIAELSPSRYREVRSGSLNFRDAYGPHTFSRGSQGTWVDWYHEIVTPLAGWNRVRWRLAARKQRRASGSV